MTIPVLINDYTANHLPLPRTLPELVQCWKGSSDIQATMVRIAACDRHNLLGSDAPIVVGYVPGYIT